MRDCELIALCRSRTSTRSFKCKKTQQKPRKRRGRSLKMNSSKVTLPSWAQMSTSIPSSPVSPPFFFFSKRLLIFLLSPGFAAPWCNVHAPWRLWQHAPAVYEPTRRLCSLPLNIFPFLDIFPFCFAFFPPYTAHADGHSLGSKNQTHIIV